LREGGIYYEARQLWRLRGDCKANWGEKKNFGKKRKWAGERSCAFLKKTVQKGIKSRTKGGKE